MARAKEKDGHAFERDLERLEEIVHALEEGGLPLDDALKHFEEGMKLKRKCEKALTAAEKRIEMLIENAEGEDETVPFDEEQADAAVSAPKAKAPRKAAASPADDTPPEPPQEDEDEEGLLF